MLIQVTLGLSPTERLLIAVCPVCCFVEGIEMRREVIEFEKFKENFIDSPWGYYPVYASITENDEGGYEKSVELDMICHWRLCDGKVAFITVPCKNTEQFDAVANWVKAGADALKNEIIKEVDENLFDERTQLFNE